MYRIFHPIPEVYSLFSAAHGHLSKVDYKIGHLTGLNKCRKSCHDEIKIIVNIKRKYNTYTNSCK